MVVIHNHRISPDRSLISVPKACRLSFLLKLNDKVVNTHTCWLYNTFMSHSWRSVFCWCLASSACRLSSFWTSEHCHFAVKVAKLSLLKCLGEPGLQQQFPQMSASMFSQWWLLVEQLSVCPGMTLLRCLLDLDIDMIELVHVDVKNWSPPRLCPEIFAWRSQATNVCHILQWCSPLYQRL